MMIMALYRIVKVSVLVESLDLWLLQLGLYNYVARAEKVMTAILDRLCYSRGYSYYFAEWQ